MAENPKLRAWRIRVLAEKNKLSNFPEVIGIFSPEDSFNQRLMSGCCPQWTFDGRSYQSQKITAFSQVTS